MEEVLKLPENISNRINDYFELKIGKTHVKSPYYMNLKKSKDLRALVGKGTPEEIEMEAMIVAKTKKMNLDEMTENEIREFLMSRGIGIDCSGFIMHILNFWYKSEKGGNIWRKFKPYGKGILYKIAYILKPVEKLGAEIITNKTNSKKVSLKDVLPGDLVRSKWKRKNSHHVLLVTKVIREEGITKEIEYGCSAEHYGKDNGMRFGEIIIKDQKKPLQDQEWVDPDENGINQIYEGYLNKVEDNGLRRTKAMEEIQKKLFRK
ncbi:MAG: hypothetical protein Q9M91_03485 [Candidatus Dojkabacteria bacterium]|nr:hypothetical protein [Candidatus Dojkabacteria bacterium]MDQ7020884.1 hypothetical protein [Candidatus Dojkabacteria bacterium]